VIPERGKVMEGRSGEEGSPCEKSEAILRTETKWTCSIRSILVGVKEINKGRIQSGKRWPGGQGLLDSL
jgi:hypothetical protein